MENQVQNIRKLESLDDLNKLNQGDLIKVITRSPAFEVYETLLVYYEKNFKCFNFIWPRKDGMILWTSIDDHKRKTSSINDGALEVSSVLTFGGYNNHEDGYAKRYDLLHKLELM